MISKKIIHLNENVSSREEALQKLCENLKTNNYISSETEFYAAVIKREEEMSTSVGYGIAIPHGKSAAVKQPFVAFMQAAKDFIWDETEKEVKMIFLIGVPEIDNGTLHLKILSQLSRNLLHQDFLEVFKNAQEKEDVYRQLKKVEDMVLQKEKGGDE